MNEMRKIMTAPQIIERLRSMTTTDLLHLIETERLTAGEMRAIRAEIKSREI